MSEIKTGGSAFPLPLGTANMSEPSESGGMTLRDYFAAKAMQGLIANHEYFDEVGGTDSVKTARISYTHADAMLAAREKGGAA